MPPPIPAEPEREEAGEKTVAPAQQQQKSAGKTGGKQREKTGIDNLVESVDNWLEVLSAEIGSGKYRSALNSAERMCKDLRDLIEKLKEKGR